ncbi:purine-cytosine permease [Rhodocollybia butyracea]|uniref:Purine-cytosine permease n=1 Tax=Rhodocollybia butyracea TaxID=206335 RepID=A0A9P5PJE4_9AGAR|nr:purine-cytosine permease [Rhodocollybia butyracea]
MEQEKNSKIDNDSNGATGTKANLDEKSSRSSLTSDERKTSSNYGSFLKHISSRALRWGIETHGITPTTTEERIDTRMWQMFTVWFSAILNLTGMSTGALGPIFFSLNFRESIIVLVIADVICCLVPSYFVVFGPKLGTRSMVQSRYSFGYYGAMLPAALNVFSQIGWLVINSIVGGQVLAAVSTDGHLNDTAGIVIIVVISLVLSFCGYKALHWYETYIWVPSVVLFIALLGVGGKQLMTQIPILNASTPAASAAMLITYGTTAGASDLTWSSYSADYGIYHQEKAKTWIIFAWAYAGIFTSAFIGHIIGAAFAAAAPAIPAWSTALNADGGNDFGSFLVAILEPVGGFGKFLVVLGALTVTAPCAITMYSFGVSLMSISPIFVRVPRYIYSLICTAIVIPIAIVGATHFFTAFEDVLNLIGYWATSYSSIVLCEHFIFRRNDFYNYSNYFGTYTPITESWNDPSKLPLGIAAVLSFLISFAVIVPSMNQPWYVGPIANAGTGDIGLITGFFGAGLCYLVLRSVELRVERRFRGGGMGRKGEGGLEGVKDGI